MASLPLILPAVSIARVIAGLMWQPEMGPIEYTSASTVRPKAKDIPINPICCPAMTALPQPITTRAAVPRSSARYFLQSFNAFILLFSLGLGLRLNSPCLYPRSVPEKEYYSGFPVISISKGVIIKDGCNNITLFLKCQGFNTKYPIKAIFV
jgi:hypothetical protein